MGKSGLRFLYLVNEVCRVEDLDGFHGDVGVLGAEGNLPKLVQLDLVVLVAG